MLRLCDPLSQVSVFSISRPLALRDCGAGAGLALVSAVPSMPPLFAVGDRFS